MRGQPACVGCNHSWLILSTRDKPDSLNLSYKIPQWPTASYGIKATVGLFLSQSGPAPHSTCSSMHICSYTYIHAYMCVHTHITCSHTPCIHAHILIHTTHSDNTHKIREGHTLSLQPSWGAPAYPSNIPLTTPPPPPGKPPYAPPHRASHPSSVPPCPVLATLKLLSLGITVIWCVPC